MEMIIIKIISAGLSSLFFGIIFNVKKDNLIYAGLGGAIAVLVYEGLHELLHVDIYTATFFAATSLALYAEVMARLCHTTVTTFVISALIPLVPGGGMYQTMLAMVENDMRRAASVGIETLGVAGLLAFGIIFASSIFKFIVRKK